MRTSIAYSLLTIRSVPADQLPTLKNQVTSCVGHITTKSKSRAVGSLKRAIITGRIPLTSNHLSQGYTVGDLLSLLPSNVHKMGVFALRDIESEHYIIAFRGELIPSNTILTFGQRKYVWKADENSPFMIDQNIVKYANITRYLNSSGENDGNVEIVWMCSQRVAVLRARVPIAAGEELLCKYPVI